MKNQKAIARITEMEEILDRATKTMDELEAKIEELHMLQSEIQKLEAYYTGKQRKQDFKLDEEGKIPNDVKRGVLSEDGIYNLLERNRELLEKISPKE